MPDKNQPMKNPGQEFGKTSPSSGQQGHKQPADKQGDIYGEKHGQQQSSSQSQSQRTKPYDPDEANL